MEVTPHRTLKDGRGLVRFPGEGHNGPPCPGYRTASELEKRTVQEDIPRKVVLCGSHRTVLRPELRVLVNWRRWRPERGRVRHDTVLQVIKRAVLRLQERTRSVVQYVVPNVSANGAYHDEVMHISAVSPAERAPSRAFSRPANRRLRGSHQPPEAQILRQRFSKSPKLAPRNSCMICACVTGVS